MHFKPMGIETPILLPSQASPCVSLHLFFCIIYHIHFYYIKLYNKLVNISLSVNLCAVLANNQIQVGENHGNFRFVPKLDRSCG